MTGLPQDPPLGVLLFIPYRAMEVRVLEAVVAAGYPLTMAQARVFQRIASDGSRLTELAAAAEVTKQSAGFLVDQLEVNGYVERVPDPSDARARLIRLTSRGHEVVAVARPVQQQVEAEWVAHLGRERTEQLYATLAELRKVTDPFA
ncbi:MarR family winged helix-turn-helix transcriptional regulator [Pedococcus sp. KACC 23699]|uniref:MarR family winged helix-turn-helix transcriptional regulator n=1 Tax=Pedococcus sp. KACC 23699 TaxID=3149228 RepID=A0AAU7JYR3_9MICO